jgi:uncharacterized RDD family membrane protein YckC
MIVEGAPAHPGTPPAPHHVGGLPLAYGGFWSRAGALLIDLVVTSLWAVPFRAGWQAVAPDLAVVGALRTSGIVVLVLWWAYFVVTTATTGGTLGKHALGLRVTDLGFGRPDWPTVFFREVVGRVIVTASLGIGYLWAAFDPAKQGWHDKIADTLVVKRVRVVPGAVDPWVRQDQPAPEARAEIPRGGRHRSSG